MSFKRIFPIFLTANVIHTHSHFKKKQQNNQANKRKPKNPQDEKRAAQ